jgi:hypothetical protein
LLQSYYYYKKLYTHEENRRLIQSQAEEIQVYHSPSMPTQEIDPEVTLERICNWLGNILRRPDLVRKLAGAKLELGKDEKGQDTATFWLVDEAVDLTSFSKEDKALIRMAFSAEVKRL